MKKVISILLCLSLILCSAVESKASIESKQCSYGETKTTEDGFVVEISTGMILGYVGNEKEVRLPVSPKKVRFIENKTIEKIIIPYSASFTNGVWYNPNYWEPDVINYNLFHGCTNLKEIVFEHENSGYVFCDGMLLSQDKTTLYAVLPGYQGVVKIPAAVTKVEEGAFVQALGVTAYEVEAGNTLFSAKNGVLYNSEGTILKAYPLGNQATEFTVPEGVKTIGRESFAYSPNLQTITMASTVERQEAFAFGECKVLVNVVNKKGLRYVGNSAYRDCISLNLKLPNGVETLPETAISGVKSVAIPASAMTATALDDIAWSVLEKGAKLPTLKVKQAKTKSSVSKGKGRASTSWYKKSKKMFKLSTPDQLAGLAKLVNQGETFKGKTIVLTKNVDMKKYKNWTPIGVWRSSTTSETIDESEKKDLRWFQGKFDGKGKTIYNLKVNNQKKEGAGFFGLIGEKGVVKNVKFKNGSVLGLAAVGGVAGTNHGKIENCSFSGAVSGRQNVGGIAGYSGKTQNCKNNATVKGCSYVGGIVGKSGSVTSCSNTGKVSGYFEVGGVSGWLACGTVKKCRNTAKVSGYSIVGGIAGSMSSSQFEKTTLKSNTNKGKVTVSLGGGLSGKIYAVKKTS